MTWVCTDCDWSGTNPNHEHSEDKLVPDDSPLYDPEEDPQNHLLNGCLKCPECGSSVVPENEAVSLNVRKRI